MVICETKGCPFNKEGYCGKQIVKIQSNWTCHEVWRAQRVDGLLNPLTGQILKTPVIINADWSYVEPEKWHQMSFDELPPQGKTSAT